MSNVLTGVAELDRSHGGIGEREFMVVAGTASEAARTALLIAHTVAVREGHPVAVVSANMSNEETVGRLVGIEAGFEWSYSLDVRRTPSEFAAMTAAAEQIKNAPIFIDAVPQRTADELVAEIRRMIVDHALRCVVVDTPYPADLSGSSADRAEAYGKLCERLNRIAKDSGATLILVAQVESAPNGERPKVEQLDWSEALQATADAILLVHRDHSSSDSETQLIIPD